jgi:hypothetical protein
MSLLDIEVSLEPSTETQVPLGQGSVATRKGGQAGLAGEAPPAGVKGL